MTAGSARHALAVARGARLGGSGSRIKKPCNTVEYLGLALLRARAGNSDHKKPYPAGGCGYAAWHERHAERVGVGIPYVCRARTTRTLRDRV